MDKRKFSEKDKEKFRKYAENKAPDSSLLKDCVFAFVIGGLICILGEFILLGAKKLGITEQNARTVVPCALIVISNVLTSLGLYKQIAKHAGAGTLVPITGFANAICSISIDSKAEGYVLGVGAKLFTIAGPVILFGTAASVIYGVIYYLFTILG